MALMIPDTGKIEVLKRFLYGTASAENISLRLYKSNTTPSEVDETATYTVADFTGYSNKTLTSSQSGATWAVPTASGNLGTSTYGTNQTWTAGSDQTVYGIYLVWATSLLICASQRFGSAKALVGADADQVTVVPKFQAGHI